MQKNQQNSEKTVKESQAAPGSAATRKPATERPSASKPAFSVDKYINIFDTEWTNAKGIKDIFVEKSDTLKVEAIQTLLDQASNPEGKSKLKGSDKTIVNSLRQRITECEINGDFMVRDFSIMTGKNKSVNDDLAYAKTATAESWLNVRDGNTLLEKYDSKDLSKLVSVSVARQGLPKFYPLNYEFVDVEKRNTVHKVAEQKHMQHQILGPVRKALLQGHAVEIVRSLKTNGDNAQISWNKSLNAWCIASKNVALMAQNIKQLEELYPEESRYYLARKIAFCWFRRLDKIEQLGMGRLESLKADMFDKTFVGEYVGDPEPVNLVRYQRETIVFHSIVLNSRSKDSTPYCLANSHRILKRHSLDTTPVQSLGPYTSYDALCDQLQAEFQFAACGSLTQGEEGRVLQFNKLNERVASEEPASPTRASFECEVISMCKIKSVEYQALRLIETTLIRAIEKDELQTYSYESLFSRYIRDLKAIWKHVDLQGLPHQDTFYIDLFSTAYTLIAKKSQTYKEYYRNLLADNQVKFFTIVVDANEEKNQGKKYVGQIEFESQLFQDIPAFMDLRREPIVFKRQDEQEAAPKTAERPVAKKQEVRKEQPAKKERVRQEKEKPQVAKQDRAEKQDKLDKQAKPEKQSKKRDQQKANTASAEPNLRNLTVLVIPPLAMPLTTFNQIEKHYKVTEVDTVKVSELEKVRGKHHLVIASSLKDIVEQSKLCQLKLFVYKLQKTNTVDFSKNFYIAKDSFYVPPSQRARLSAASVRNEIKKQMDFIAQNVLLQVGNPANILVKDDEELLVVLGLKDPNLTVTQEDIVGQPNSEVQIEVEQEQIIEEEKFESISPIIKEKKRRTENAVKIAEKQTTTKHKEQKAEQTQSSGKKQIIVILPVGIPGMGETHFIKHSLKPSLIHVERKSDLHVLSNDKTRKTCMDGWVKDNPDATVDEAVKRTARDTSVLFQQNLSDTLTKALETKSDLQIVYLDKNYIPGDIGTTINTINNHEANQTASITKVALVPHIENPLQNFPFSLSFFIQCYIRCLDRSGHLTLPNEDPERLLEILKLFFLQFKNTKNFDGEFVDAFGFDDLLAVNFTLEHKDLELPPQLERLLKQAIGVQTQHATNPIAEACELISLYRGLFGSKAYRASRGEIDQLSQDIETITAEHSAPSQKKHTASVAVEPETNHSVPAANTNDESSRNTSLSFIKITDPIEEQEKEISDTEEERKQPAPIAQPKEVEAPKSILKKQKPQQKPQAKAQPVQEEAPKPVVQRPAKKQAPSDSQFSNLWQKTEPVKEVKKPQSYFEAKKQAARKNDDDEFEVVERSNRGLANMGDSDDEDYRVPMYLGIKLFFKSESEPVGQQVSAFLEDLLVTHTIPRLSNPVKQTAQVAADLDQINSLIKTMDSYEVQGGWRLLSEYAINVLQLNKDADLAENSDIYANFEEYVHVEFKVPAVLFVPGKMLVALTRVDKKHAGGDKHPHLVLMTNDWFSKLHAQRLLDNAANGRNSPFGDAIRALYRGAERKTKKSVISGQVTVQGTSAQAYLIILDEPQEYKGATYKFF